MKTPDGRGDTRQMTGRAMEGDLLGWFGDLLTGISREGPEVVTDIDLMVEHMREEQDARALQYPA